jgi:NADPH-dependent 2,4-dienoyl-CoA reductase/sulfur reductase-like enzyme/nitrite reductase/ring-hydroxylating ferredoxin subunit
MGGPTAPLTGPDFTKGIELAEVPEKGMLLGNAHGEAVLLVRQGGEAFAVGATCTHYGAPLGDGLLLDGKLHCPWHHACFDPRTGAAIGPPALDPLPCWQVTRQGSRIVVGAPLAAAPKPKPLVTPESVVIVGAGAAGNAAAETLRREGYLGPVTMIGAESTLPVDRPKLSKDVLDGTAPEASVALRDEAFYAGQSIELRLGVRVISLDAKDRRVQLSDGKSLGYGALLLATGAEPVKLEVPGSERPQVCCLRSRSDCRTIIERAKEAKRAVVVGGSFIALEVAASLRARGLEVDVVAPEARPLERVLGPELGDFVRALHEEHGVRFHLKHKLRSIEEGRVVLEDGTSLPTDLIVVGVGVRPALELADQAGLQLDRGVRVDEFLETSAPGVYAAGDIARWPSRQPAKPLRVEHWVVAERQGQTAARNILGQREPFCAVPFFWSQHYDVTIAYVGHAEHWERLEVFGSLQDRSCLVAYRVSGKIAAVASLNRDKESLRAEVLLERSDQTGLEELLKSVAPPAPVIDDEAAADGGKLVDDVPIPKAQLEAIMKDAVDHTREEAGS